MRNLPKCQLHHNITRSMGVLTNKVSERAGGRVTRIPASVSALVRVVA